MIETHDKYIESWYFLCALVENYHNAKLFRWYLNAFIQSLRNVTFVLQAEKDKTPEFDKWYGVHQENMRANPLLKNFKEGRNIVVKQRMLKARSTATAGIFHNNTMKIGIGEITLDPFEDTINLFEKAKAFFIPFMLDEQHAVWGEQVGIKRIWIVEEIGSEEIAMLCYQAWLVIGEIVEDAHKVLGFEFVPPTLEIQSLPQKYTLLETDMDPTLPDKWGWYKSQNVY